MDQQVPRDNALHHLQDRVDQLGLAGHLRVCRLGLTGGFWATNSRARMSTQDRDVESAASNTGRSVRAWAKGCCQRRARTGNRGHLRMSIQREDRRASDRFQSERDAKRRADFWHHPGVRTSPSALSTVRRLALAWLCFGPLGAQAVDGPPDPALIGCWRAERVEQTLPDGSLWSDIGGCTLEFAADRIVSACALREGNRPITYTYKIVEPGKYRARITDHPARRKAEGSERDYEYRVDRDRLFIITYPQTAKPAPATSVVRVLSVSVRVGSPTDLARSVDVEKADCRGRLVSLPEDNLLASAGLSPGP